MSRKEQRHRQPPSLRRRLVPLAVLAAAVMAVAGWWATDALRNAPQGGVTLASLRPPDIHSLTVARSSAGDVIFAVTAEGLRRSANAGRTWQAVPEVSAAYVSAVGDFVYATAGSTVFVSSDAGAVWQRKTFPPGRAALIAPAPSRPETLYVVTDRFEVHRSRDGGSTWERVG